MKKSRVVICLSLLVLVVALVAWQLQWIGFRGFTLWIGKLEFPLLLAWLWLLWLIVVATGKMPTKRGIISRPERPLEFWFGAVMLGFVAALVTFVWNWHYRDFFSRIQTP